MLDSYPAILEKRWLTRISCNTHPCRGSGILHSPATLLCAYQTSRAFRRPGLFEKSVQGLGAGMAPEERRPGSEAVYDNNSGNERAAHEWRSDGLLIVARAVFVKASEVRKEMEKVT